MQIQRKHLAYGLMAVAVVIGIISLSIGHPLINPEHLAGLGAVPFAFTGEMDMKEIKTLLEKQGEAWGAFTKKNDELLQAKADGKAVSELQSTVDKINGEFTKLNQDLMDLAKKASRPELGGAEKLSADQAAYKSAFGQFLRKGDENGLSDLQTKAYNAGSGPDGGYFVLPEMDKEIIRVVSVVSAIGRLARNVPISSSSYKKMAKKSGMTARRVGPGASGGETATPQWAELEFTAHEGEAEPKIFNSTLEDSVIDLEKDLADEAAIAFAELAGFEFAAGSGVGSARGITSYDIVANANYAWGKLGYVPSGAAGAFRTAASGVSPGDDLINLQHSLKSQYRPGAAFVMPDSTLALVRQMKDGSGAFYLWQPDPLAGFGGRLLGSPVEIDDNMPAVAADSLSIAYGNFAQGYVVVNRSGTVVIRDNITEKGKTKFNFRRRWGGGVQNFEAIKLMKFAAA